VVAHTSGSPAPGTIRVTATSSLDADLSGTGAIVYSGNPATVTKSVAGTGAITAGQWPRCSHPVRLDPYGP
jgi:hypothetical protein